MLVPLAALMLAACGGGGDQEGAAAADTVTTPPPNTNPASPAPVGTVDTAGVGASATEPPTAGGQLVDTAAVPGPTDTIQGTTTAP